MLTACSWGRSIVTTWDECVRTYVREVPMTVSTNSWNSSRTRESPMNMMRFCLLETSAAVYRHRLMSLWNTQSTTTAGLLTSSQQISTQRPKSNAETNEIKLSWVTSKRLAKKLVHVRKLLPKLTLRVIPYQSGTPSSPSSSPSSGSDPVPVVDISRGVFPSRLKTLLYSIFPSIAIYFICKCFQKAT